jgi:hypothetical protein
VQQQPQQRTESTQQATPAPKTDHARPIDAQRAVNVQSRLDRRTRTVVIYSFPTGLTPEMLFDEWKNHYEAFFMNKLIGVTYKTTEIASKLIRKGLPWFCRDLRRKPENKVDRCPRCKSVERIYHIYAKLNETFE